MLTWTKPIGIIWFAAWSTLPYNSLSSLTKWMLSSISLSKYFFHLGCWWELLKQTLNKKGGVLKNQEQVLGVELIFPTGKQCAVQCYMMKNIIQFGNACDCSKIYLFVSRCDIDEKSNQWLGATVSCCGELCSNYKWLVCYFKINYPVDLLK